MSGATAIHRKGPSAPVRWLNKNGFALIGEKGLDYGCGHGADAEFLEFDGWDPSHRAVPTGRDYETITCTYVLNVLHPTVWKEVLERIAERLAYEGRAFITVRRDLWKGGDRRPRQGRGCKQYLVDLPLPVQRNVYDYVIYYGSKTDLQAAAYELRIREVQGTLLA